MKLCALTITLNVNAEKSWIVEFNCIEPICAVNIHCIVVAFNIRFIVVVAVVLPSPLTLGEINQCCLLLFLRKMLCHFIAKLRHLFVAKGLSIEAVVVANQCCFSRGSQMKQYEERKLSVPCLI